MTEQEAFDVDMAWRDLVIAGPQLQIDQFLDEIERLLPKGWVRNTGAEEKSQELVKRKGWHISSGRCYSRALADYEVRLWLTRVSVYRVHGGLVEPTKLVRYLDDNAETIRDFRQRILGPAAKLSGLTPSRYSFGPLSLVPNTVLEALWAFYDSSQFRWPPEGGAARTWRAFVTSAYQNHAAFDGNELHRWLVEKGWEASKAEELFRQLLMDAALLSEYDELRQPV